MRKLKSAIISISNNIAPSRKSKLIKGQEQSYNQLYRIVKSNQTVSLPKNKFTSIMWFRLRLANNSGIQYGLFGSASI